MTDTYVTSLQSIPSDTPAAPPNRGAVRAVTVLLLGAAGLFLAWMASGSLLLIFGGLMIASLFDAASTALGRVTPFGRTWNLALVATAVTLVAAGFIYWSGVSFATQFNDLIRALNEQLHIIAQKMAELGVTSDTGGDRDEALSNFSRMLFPDPQQFVGEARNAFTLAVGGIAELFVVMLIGLFVAADPPTYRRSIVELFPRHRAGEVALILDETAFYLRRWLLGQLAAMVLLAILTIAALLALGVPSAVLLGLLAGLFTFVPYLGAIIGGVPILLIALPLGATTTLIVLGVYTVIHVVVGYGFIPVVQKHLVRLPPAWTLASLMLFGALFGVGSVAVATPIVAAIRHTIRRLQGTATPAQKAIRAPAA